MLNEEGDVMYLKIKQSNMQNPDGPGCKTKSTSVACNQISFNYDTINGLIRPTQTLHPTRQAISEKTTSYRDILMDCYYSLATITAEVIIIVVNVISYNDMH